MRETEINSSKIVWVGHISLQNSPLLGPRWPQITDALLVPYGSFGVILSARDSVSELSHCGGNAKERRGGGVTVPIPPPASQEPPKVSCLAFHFMEK